MFNSQTIDRLMHGIQSIISENRSSFSDGEISLLKECLTYLDTVKSSEDSASPMILIIVSSVIKILLRVLLCEDFDKMKELFF